MDPAGLDGKIVGLDVGHEAASAGLCSEGDPPGGHGAGLSSNGSTRISDASGRQGYLTLCRNSSIRVNGPDQLQTGR